MAGGELGLVDGDRLSWAGWHLTMMVGQMGEAGAGHLAMTILTMMVGQKRKDEPWYLAMPILTMMVGQKKEDGLVH